MRHPIAALLLGTLIWGCEPGRPSLQAVVPAQLEIATTGRLPVDARVVLHPVQGDPAGMIPARPHGIVAANGAVALTTFHTDDGAPEGDYVVTLIWPAQPASDSPGPDQFSGRFADPARSPLKVSVRKESPTIRLVVPR